jgi:hypothetical protein
MNIRLSLAVHSRDTYETQLTDLLGIRRSAEFGHPEGTVSSGLPCSPPWMLTLAKCTKSGLPIQSYFPLYPQEDRGISSRHVSPDNSSRLSFPCSPTYY